MSSLLNLAEENRVLPVQTPLLPPGMGPTLLVSTHMVAQVNDSQLQLSNNFLDNLDTKIVFISEIVLFGFVCLSLRLFVCFVVLFCFAF